MKDICARPGSRLARCTAASTASSTTARGLRWRPFHAAAPTRALRAHRQPRCADRADVAHRRKAGRRDRGRSRPRALNWPSAKATPACCPSSQGRFASCRRSTKPRRRAARRHRKTPMTTPRPETSTSFAAVLRENLRRLSADQVLPYLIALTPDETTELNFYWDVFGRGHQRPPPGDWTTWLLLGGRGPEKPAPAPNGSSSLH